MSVFFLAPEGPVWYDKGRKCRKGAKQGWGKARFLLWENTSPRYLFFIPAALFDGQVF
jgi:hypothetical protein